jgi:hypothetical protein
MGSFFFKLIKNSSIQMKCRKLPQDTLDTLINEGEGACLLAITPHLEVLGGSQGLPAEGSWGLLTST